MTTISIPKGSFNLAGLLFTPPSATNDDTKLTAVIIVHPAGGVKEQTALLYAEKLARRGFVTLCYDASHQGESGGEPRFLEDPARRVSDVWAVVDYLQHQRRQLVDPDRIAVFGICAGGGYAVAAAAADHRLRAVAAVSMVNAGDASRQGWLGTDPPSQHIATLRQAAQAMTATTTTTAPVAVPYALPPLDDATTPRDLRELFDYYSTPRAQHPRSENKMLIQSLPRLLTFDAFQSADVYLTQPLILIAGEEAGSRWHTERLDKIVATRDDEKKVVVIPKATHVDLYDNEEFVNLAVQEIAEFVTAKLL